ncbi:H-2 class II histocompatibility antigen, I-E beta chain-like, partial [Python bivittatus]|uniref:H-2 class II histocompatibility antigen, I-E beta chain-like n=1 Tax=Python bivittatus TaxID=176946 RepID=A0A9F2RE13_PYTBI
HFLYQWKSDCHFLNGTQRVRFLDRDIYERQGVVRVDSPQEIRQDERAAVDYFCRHNYEVLQGAPVVGRRAKPTVTISPTKTDPGSPNTILLCTVTGFYPRGIDVQWLKSGRPEKEGVAFGEELQNGDWTYQHQ